jgi:predicted Fe-Mo cluster-binding NifX family protein
MRIAATASGTTLDSGFDPKFGRCQYFLFIDTDDKAVECVENPHRATSGGTGTRCAQLLADQNITLVLTGEAGPNARRALEAAGITVVTGCSGRIADTVAGLGDTSPGDSR